MSLLPCLFERTPRKKIWGGRRLETMFGFELPAGQNIGETWEIHDRPEGSSRVRDSDETLSDLMRRDAIGLLGEGVTTAPDGRFPLLLKFLDASDALSVQVHPDEEQARDDPDRGKSEAWVVLHTGSDARIVRGVKPGVSTAGLEAAVDRGEIEGLIDAFTPRVGDVLHIPPGTVHSAGPGVVLYEIQRNSDLTYRLWDWGRSRELQPEKALRAVRVSGEEPAVVIPRAVGDGIETLVEDPSFRLQRVRVSEPRAFETAGAFLILTLLEGRAALGWRSGGRDTPLRLDAGDSALVPACLETVFLSPIGEATLLAVTPGGR